MVSIKLVVANIHVINYLIKLSSHKSALKATLIMMGKNLDYDDPFFNVVVTKVLKDKCSNLI